jgi:hypothetical protein
MPVADSPLRDRVVFVEGAPRSGTTLLVSLLASHPDVAGTVAESHLFDQGVGTLFENRESEDPFGGFLVNYVTREQLIDAVRDLCDSVLGHMRDRENAGARWVVEKTPAPPSDAEIVLARKRAVYPDAWFVHVVREREAVVRSLMRAPWNRRDEAGSTRWWQEAVDGIRAALGSSDRYIEIGYDRLAEAPAETMADLFGWLGLSTSEAIMAQVEELSKERISSFPRPLNEGAARAGGGGTRRLRQRLRRVLNRRRAPGPGLIRAAVVAMRSGDRDRLSELTSKSLRATLRGGSGDREAEGTAALDLLVELGRVMFARPFWSETWSSTAEKEITTVLFSGTRGGERVDVSLTFGVAQGTIDVVGVIAAGDPGGRRSEVWDPEEHDS